MKIFAFRWDVDHKLGIDVGVPKILEITHEYDVKCTFFVNMGKSINLKEWILRSPGKTLKKLDESESLNLFTKLGYWGVLKLVLANPDVGLSNPSILNEAKRQGHELGLHGGMDHIAWSRNLDAISSEGLMDTIKTAYEHFKDLFGKPEGFASPGFMWNRSVLRFIDEIGFSYSSDLADNWPFYPVFEGEKFNHLQIPVTIIGPNKVPYLEWLYSKRLTEEQIIKKTKEEISKHDFAVIYGHPSFEGLKNNVLNQILDYIWENEYEPLKFNEIVDRWSKRDDVAVRDIQTLNKEKGKVEGC